ncbi:protein BREAKING OF ASYMMETRY IN THE STOMATAL LINEAGE isoform X2 [Cucumis melo]|uniref:Protein BREAKING OF ASYMMETRY IN THE STOMATAL LINEAGE isoform X2 n=1 Tax=Cucumis melo TaxID=3656 RepID=A0A1S3BXU2_CUCME|nr:protein BREAKING OF ASYMMETRY IN THE STOMATAL LINEAGE isoform X2 [Cucumis melo]
MQKTSVVFDMMSITSKGKGNCKKMSRHRKRSLPQAKDIVVEKKTTMMDSSSRPQFEDEDYIVFCFKEDGALDVIKNGNNSQTSHYIDLVSTSSRPLNYSEYDKAAKRYNNGDHIISPQKEDEGEEMKNIHMDKEENRMANHNQLIDNNSIVAVPTESSDSNYSDVASHNQMIDNHPIVAVPTESSDSNYSDVSNGSFAFPVLGWEWSGSPVQMPKSKGLQLRKHKVGCVGGFLFCCKF